MLMFWLMQQTRICYTVVESRLHFCKKQESYSKTNVTKSQTIMVVPLKKVMSDWSTLSDLVTNVNRLPMLLDLSFKKTKDKDVQTFLERLFMGFCWLVRSEVIDLLRFRRYRQVFLDFLTKSALNQSSKVSQPFSRNSIK